VARRTRPRRTTPAPSAGDGARPALDQTGDSHADSSSVTRAIQIAISSGEIVSVGVLNLVRSTLVAVLGGVREIGAEVATAAVAAVRGAIRAAAEIGGDLGLVAKQAVRGAIQAADEIGGDLGSVARSTARGAVRAAADVGGDVATVARRAVEGAADAAREIGADVTKLARSAADGAIEAADGIGGATRRAVRNGVGRVAGSVRDLVDRRASTSGQRRPGRGGRRARSGRAPAVGARAGRLRGGRARGGRRKIRPTAA
jgi:phage-related protein